MKIKYSTYSISITVMAASFCLFSCFGSTSSKNKDQNKDQNETKKDEGPKINAIIDTTGKYPTTQLGDQVWTTENLNVSNFRNGDPIPEAKTEEEWTKYGKSRKPAYCYLNDDPTNEKKYGKLYNFFAVADPRGLAPEGYHVATSEEWHALFKYLDHKKLSRFVSIMKSTSGWEDNGTNESGFNAVPSGSRTGSYSLGKFMGLDGAFWWDANVYEKDDLIGEYAGYHNLGNNSEGTGKSDWDCGYSVRCLKD